MPTIKVLVAPGGTIRYLYNEVLDLSSLGPKDIHRATTVEFGCHPPSYRTGWYVDFGSRLEGRLKRPRVGGFAKRSQALAFEEFILLRTGFAEFTAKAFKEARRIFAKLEKIAERRSVPASS